LKRQILLINTKVQGVPREIYKGTKETNTPGISTQKETKTSNKKITPRELHYQTEPSTYYS
jgi:hypothetical protein